MDFLLQYWELLSLILFAVLTGIFGKGYFKFKTFIDKLDAALEDDKVTLEELQGLINVFKKQAK